MSVFSDAARAADRVVVDEDEERDLLVAHERIRVAPVAGTDRDDVGTEAGDLFVALTQLRGMFAAVQSTEMSEEDQHDRVVTPQVAEPVRRAGRVDERHVGKGGEIHGASLPGRVLVSSRRSPARSRHARIASATIVSVGPYPVEVGNTDESVHTMFSTSWNRCHRSTTLVAGSSPIRHVPMMWRDIDALRVPARSPSRGGDVAANVDVGSRLADHGFEPRREVARRHHFVRVHVVRRAAGREAVDIADRRIEVDPVRDLREVLALHR